MTTDNPDLEAELNATKAAWKADCELLCQKTSRAADLEAENEWLQKEVSALRAQQRPYGRNQQF